MKVSKFPELSGIAETVKIILLLGCRGDGKTKAAESINRHNSSFRIDSFARPLKEAFAAKYSIPLDHLYDTVFKEEYRHDIQRFSQEQLAIDPYHYVRELFMRATPAESIVIDDGRTLFELEMALELGAVPYRVYTDPYVKKARGFKRDPIADSHYTETELTFLSHHDLKRMNNGGWILNNGTYDDLDNEVSRMMIQHKFYLTPTLTR